MGVSRSTKKEPNSACIFEIPGGGELHHGELAATVKKRIRRLPGGACVTR